MPLAVSGEVTAKFLAFVIPRKSSPLIRVQSDALKGEARQGPKIKPLPVKAHFHAAVWPKQLFGRS
jgi:hypothetical protein